MSLPLDLIRNVSCSISSQSAAVSSCRTVKLHIPSQLTTHHYHSHTPFSSSTHFSSSILPRHLKSVKSPSVSPPSSSTSSSAVPRLSLHPVTCVSHSRHTCCFTPTHLCTRARLQRTHLPVRRSPRETERETPVFVPKHLPIFNLKLTPERCLSCGSSAHLQQRVGTCGGV